MGDDQALDRVGDEFVLGEAQGTAGGHRVRDLQRRVPVGRFTDVVALFAVGLETAPGLLQQFQDVPLGDALFHAAGEGLGGVLAVDRLVGREQRDTVLFQLVLDLRAEVGAAGHPADVLTDHRVEAPVGPLGLGQEVLEASLPWDGDGEPLVAPAEAAR
ncbi:MAG: hypothetical protein ABIS86_11455 [Streptosporangiaceae bacterium]